MQFHTSLTKSRIAIPYSKDELEPFEYSKSPLLKLLGFRECKRLGRMVRRILEEGRRRRVVEAGFGNARVVEYVGGDVTGDNLAIVASASLPEAGHRGKRE